VALVSLRPVPDCPRSIRHCEDGSTDSVTAIALSASMFRRFDQRACRIVPLALDASFG
jgi:hypothetical protein